MPPHARLTRHLFTLLAALSLLLFLATLLLWFRSHRCTERIVWQPTTGGSYWLSTAKGSLVFGVFRVKNAYATNETFGPRYHREDGWASPPMSPFAVMELDPPLTTFDWQHIGITLQTRTAFPAASSTSSSPSAASARRPHRHPPTDVDRPPSPREFQNSPRRPPRPLPHLRLRPPRQPRPLPRMRNAGYGKSMTCVPTRTQTCRGKHLEL